MNLINEFRYCFCSNEISYENDVNKLFTEEFRNKQIGIFKLLFNK